MVLRGHVPHSSARTRLGARPWSESGLLATTSTRAPDVRHSMLDRCTLLFRRQRLRSLQGVRAYQTDHEGVQVAPEHLPLSQRPGHDNRLATWQTQRTGDGGGSDTGE